MIVGACGDIARILGEGAFFVSALNSFIVVREEQRTELCEEFQNC